MKRTICFHLWSVTESASRGWLWHPLEDTPIPVPCHWFLRSLPYVVLPYLNVCIRYGSLLSKTRVSPWCFTLSCSSLVLLLALIPAWIKCYATGLSFVHRPSSPVSLAFVSHSLSSLKCGCLGLDCLKGSVYSGPLALSEFDFCPHSCCRAPTLARYFFSLSLFSALP